MLANLCWIYRRLFPKAKPAQTATVAVSAKEVKLNLVPSPLSSPPSSLLLQLSFSIHPRLLVIAFCHPAQFRSLFWSCIWGSHFLATVHSFSISCRFLYTPTVSPAQKAAPIPVVSVTTGFTTGTLSISAWNCIMSVLLLPPPSTASWSSSTFESFFLQNKNERGVGVVAGVRKNRWMHICRRLVHLGVLHGVKDLSRLVGCCFQRSTANVARMVRGSHSYHTSTSIAAPMGSK